MMAVFKPSFFKELEQIAFLTASLLEQKKATLAVAESLTGGLVSHLLTLKPGISQFFLGSIVCYSPSIKIKHLNIPKSLLKKEGVVSETVALLMAQTVKKKWGSQYGLSLTGLAGPSKEAGDPPIGTVFIGFSGPKFDRVQKQFFLTKSVTKPVKQALPSLIAKPASSGIKKTTLNPRFVIQQKSAFSALTFLKTCIEGH